MAPEVMVASHVQPAAPFSHAPLSTGSLQYDERCDVYSFALLMWELLFESPPPNAFTSRFQDAPHDLLLLDRCYVRTAQPHR